MIMSAFEGSAAAAGPEWGQARRRDLDRFTVTAVDPTGDQTMLYGVLPDGEPRAGGAPGVHHLRIRARLHGDPLDEIEYERFVL